MKRVRILLKKKKGCEDIPVPKYATSGSSGMDLCADVEEGVILEPGDIRLISTGIYLDIPEGYEAEIRPRSGLALKHGIGLVNSPGTIDSDYRGLVSLILINHGKESFKIRRGERVAQMVIKEVVRAEIDLKESLSGTARASGGFGHTGK
ncbi:MAG: deoxyuridine 5'-triphosphate nucleotidohydrolase [Omnitrophica bacterium RIFCSPLOWO2_01_FULL_45_10]|nr:MAG: deoxyuridine 5'-triphosphate nucleotidohydrolase [Omnitrophica bacterium RIFCSPLOWO2_01_FULL_45_10]